MSLSTPIRWISDSRVEVIEGVLDVADDGGASVRITGRRPLDAAPAVAAPVLPRRSGACGGCGAVPVVRWLGVRWIGTPWPLRQWRRLIFADRPSDWRGCGCILFAKRATEAVATVVRFAASNARNVWRS